MVFPFVNNIFAFLSAKRKHQSKSNITMNKPVKLGVESMSSKNELTISENGLQILKEFEGFRTKPYLCSAGVATIGYGSTFYEDGTRVTLRDSSITEDRAVELLKNVVADFEEVVRENVKVDLNQNQFDALVDFVYNVGSGAFKTSTLLRLLNDGDYSGAAKQFKRWNKVNGKESNGLTRRRLAESTLFESK